MIVQDLELFRFAFGALLLWLFVFCLWRDYRLDALREDLFTLREELFMYAANGSVSFDHPAYTLLRQRINMVIRYAHHFTLTAFIVVMIYVSPLKKNPEVAQWEEIVDSLPSPEVRNWLRACNTAVALTIFRHALLRPFSLYLLFALPRLLVLAWKCLIPPSTMVSAAVAELKSEAMEADRLSLRVPKRIDLQERI